MRGHGKEAEVAGQRGHQAVSQQEQQAPLTVSLLYYHYLVTRLTVEYHPVRSAHIRAGSAAEGEWCGQAARSSGLSYG